MEDILKKLGNVETDVSEVKAQVNAIYAIIPHLSTKADVSALETAIIKLIIEAVFATAVVAFIIAKFVH